MEFSYFDGLQTSFFFSCSIKFLLKANVEFFFLRTWPKGGVSRSSLILKVMDN